MESQDLQSQRLDHLGIVAGICHEIGLIEVIDTHIEEPQRKVSIGQAVQAMVINGLGFVSRPLYLTPEYFHNKPVDLLIGEGLEAADLNDDSLGRALDHIFRHGVTELFAAISARALSTFGIETRYAHLDSTSFGLHGEYADRPTAEDLPDSEPIPITITHGYSRDRRPDLKQAMLSLICANSASLPTWLQALDGNSSDSSSFKETIRAYLAQFKDQVEMPVRVADAALYNRKSLQALPADARYVSRVPATLNAVKHLYQTIEDDDFFQADEQTRYHEVGSYYAGIPQRWLVVCHDPTRLQKDKTLRDKVARERERVEKKLAALCNKDYGCEDAVHKAITALTKKWRYHRVQTTLVTEKRYDGRGRPTDDSPFHRVWRVDAVLEEDDEHLARLRRTHGKYVIATNVLEEEQLGLLEMLAIYKEQSIGVERGFRFLKDPMFFADSLFLKKPARIMALLMIMGISLLVYALAEHQVRQQLAERDETIPDQKGQPTQRPTMRRIFQMMEGIDVLLIEESGTRRRFILNLTDLRRQIICLFSQHVQKIYDPPD